MERKPLSEKGMDESRNFMIMKNVKVQIVEDDPSYALELEMILHDLGYKVLPVIDAPAKVKLTDSSPPDIMIVDIFFNNKPLGLDLVGKMRKKGIPVILLTSKSEEDNYNRSRGLLPAGYAVKPIAPLSLKSLIENALVLERNPDALNSVLEDWNRKQIINRYIFVRHGGVLVKVNVGDIRKIEADGNYCYIHEQDRRFIVKSSLRNLKDLLSPHGFIQVSRGSLINFNHIDQVDFVNSIVFCGEEKNTIGNAYRKEIEDWLNRI